MEKKSPASQAASAMAKARWDKTSKADRAKVSREMLAARWGRKKVIKDS
jgi:hypothetical protein